MKDYDRKLLLKAIADLKKIFLKFKIESMLMDTNKLLESKSESIDVDPKSYQYKMFNDHKMESMLMDTNKLLQPHMESIIAISSVGAESNSYMHKMFTFTFAKR